MFPYVDFSFPCFSFVSNCNQLKPFFFLSHNKPKVSIFGNKFSIHVVMQTICRSMHSTFSTLFSFDVGFVNVIRFLQLVVENLMPVQLRLISNCEVCQSS